MVVVVVEQALGRMGVVNGGWCGCVIESPFGKICVVPEISSIGRLDPSSSSSLSLQSPKRAGGYFPIILLWFHTPSLAPTSSCSLAT